MERLEAAMAVAKEHPFRLTGEDAADFVDRELAGRPDRWTAYVLMHSIMWQYLPEATKARIEAALEHQGRGPRRRRRSPICAWSRSRARAVTRCCR
jgi:hypothetical protein